MAQGALISKPLVRTQSSRSPSLRPVYVVPFGSSGEAFNWEISRVLSEEPNVPAGLRWWNERARRFAKEKRGIGERWRRTIRQYLEAMPRAFQRAGRTPPTGPADVTAEDVQALKDTRFWANSTPHTNLVALREFLRWSGNQLSEDKETWLTPQGRRSTDAGSSRPSSARSTRRLEAENGSWLPWKGSTG